MKNKFLSVICIVVAGLIMCAVIFAGCFGNSNVDNSPKRYTIQYTDDVGTHHLTVTSGMPYSLDRIPMRNGYNFIGLFDAEVGGTQYVSASGASLQPYNSETNVVLFPQFKAKDYTVILDYQGAPVTGTRQLTVSYDSSFPKLPQDLTVEHKDFVGWYTETNCSGIQIADRYGLIPGASVLNDKNFDLSREYVYIYAGFEVKKFTVTCHFEPGINTESIQVEYNTSINQIIPKTRINGNAPLVWAKSRDGLAFNGNITEDMDLYAVEYAPVLEIDLNTGADVQEIVARVGDPISLPTPQKQLSEFAYWIDEYGKKFTQTTMPENSTKLKAVWRNKLVFNSNGGSEVADISGMAGERYNSFGTDKKWLCFCWLV